MLKMYERLVNTSCWNKANEQERMFILLARDIASPWTLYFWCFLRLILRKNKWQDEQIQEALECAKLMKEERKKKK